MDINKRSSKNHQSHYRETSRLRVEFNVTTVAIQLQRKSLKRRRFLRESRKPKATTLYTACVIPVFAVMQNSFRGRSLNKSTSFPPTIVTRRSEQSIRKRKYRPCRCSFLRDACAAAPKRAAIYYPTGKSRGISILRVEQNLRGTAVSIKISPGTP